MNKEADIIEEKKEKKVELKEEQLDKINGGSDDYDFCEYSPTQLHEWEDYEKSPGVKGRRCKWCLIRLY